MLVAPAHGHGGGGGGGGGGGDVEEGGKARAKVGPAWLQLQQDVVFGWGWNGITGKAGEARAVGAKSSTRTPARFLPKELKLGS